MSLAAPLPPRRGTIGRVAAMLATPAVVVFLASNFVNVGNLAFNMIFSRLMGPELFGVLAFMLTLKLALLGVLGAFQSAVSQMVAGTAGDEEAGLVASLSRINRLILAGAIPFGLVLASGYAVSMSLGSLFAPDHVHLILLILASLPFGASLSLLRGLAFGHMNAARIAISANVEMIVRLAGALLAWQAGFGIEGVVVAIGLSIVAGWAVLSDLLPLFGRAPAPARAVAGPLVLAALPFGLLQLAQVLALDGDIFLAKAILPADEAGHLAALSLFQRIQFFGCFALASILLPGIVIAVRRQTGLLASALPVAALFGAVSAGLLVLAAIMPGPLVRLLVGGAYGEAAPMLLPAILASVSFTLAYLVATFLAAIGDRAGIFLVFAAALLQLSLMAVSGADTVAGLLQIKVACQLATATLIIIHAVRVAGRHGTTTLQ